MAQAQALAEANWKAFVTHAERWYFDLDTEAVRIAFSVYISHWFLSAEPVWLFIVGPAGTGKTVVVNAINTQPATHLMSDLTAQTFLSGFNRGRGGYSFLERMGKNGVLLFKDWTTFLSKKPDERAEIASQLREIYDGKFVRSVGAVKKDMAWEGKVTAIAGTTPAVEKAWTLMRDLGERWVTVRWNRPDGPLSAIKSFEQIGHEDEIKKEMEQLSSKLLDPKSYVPADVPDVPNKHQEIIYLAELVARVRAHVQRDGQGRGAEASVAEGPTRIMKALAQTVRAHATLFHRKTPNEFDLSITRRMAMDSIPSNRRRILDIFPGDLPLNISDLVELTGMARETVEWTMDELVALRVAKQDADSHEKCWELTDDYQELKAKALPPTPRT